jgi:hypothetical protein
MEMTLDITVTEYLVEVPTRYCIVCGQTGMIHMSAGSWAAYAKGAHIQDAAPLMDRAIREQLISGLHPGCWTAIFGDGEEE